MLKNQRPTLVVGPRIVRGLLIQHQIAGFAEMGKKVSLISDPAFAQAMALRVHHELGGVVPKHAVFVHCMHDGCATRDAIHGIIDVVDSLGDRDSIIVDFDWPDGVIPKKLAKFLMRCKHGITVGADHVPDRWRGYVHDACPQSSMSRNRPSRYPSPPMN